MTNWTMSEEAANDLMADAHITCIECGAGGCKGCPSGGCPEDELISHEGEWMHPGCVEAFDRAVANVAAEAVPVEIIDDLEETTPVQHLTNNEIAALDPLGIFTKEAA